MDEKTIYNLGLHEALKIKHLSFPATKIIIITRVPGGWIYTIKLQTGTDYYGDALYIVENSTFVPFNSEFMK